MKQPDQITKKQSIILNFLQEFPDALSAQDLHRVLREKGHSIGLATVYRALEALKLQGVIKSTTTPQGEALYSVIPIDRHHLYCLRCGRSFPIDMCPLEGINQQLKDKYNFHVYYHTLEFFGICSQCQSSSIK